MITYTAVCALREANNKTAIVNVILHKNRSKAKKLNVRHIFLKKLSLRRHLKVRRVYNVLCVISSGRFYFPGVGILFFFCIFHPPLISNTHLVFKSPTNFYINNLFFCVLRDFFQHVKKLAFHL